MRPPNPIHPGRFFPSRWIHACTFVLLIASLAIAHRPDDFSRFDHQYVQVISVGSDGAMRIVGGDDHAATVKLPGVDCVAAAGPWLSGHLVGRQVTLLLEWPQTRDSAGNLRAFVFIENQNVSVELVKAGLAYVDRREKTEMDGLLDPAESEARKKKRGLWGTVTLDQMPGWRREWLKALPKWKG